MVARQAPVRSNQPCLLHHHRYIPKNGQMCSQLLGRPALPRYPAWQACEACEVWPGEIFVHWQLRLDFLICLMTKAFSSQQGLDGWAAKGGLGTLQVTSLVRVSA